MLYTIHVIFFVFALASALPTQPKQSENTISSNEIDFSDELPHESEYYRTSTDRDDFERPIPSIDGNEIDDDGTGVDLTEENANGNGNGNAPECTYGITVTVLCENEACNSNDSSVHVKNLNIETRNLVLRSDRRSNLSLNKFVRHAQMEIIQAIESDNNYSNELLNNVVNYVREKFSKTYGYEDNCGISVTLFSEFGTREETTVPSRNTADTENDEIEVEVEVSTKYNQKTPDDVEIINVSPTTDTTESDDFTTEPLQPRVLKRPDLSSIVQDAINVYKALNNWKYPSQSQS